MTSSHYHLEGATCDCGAEIVFRRNDSTGKIGPVDAKPNPTGNVVLWPNGEYHVLRKGEVPKGERFVNHYVTCPNRAKFGKKRQQ